MARKNIDGRYILAAGEIGVFTVCPEAWRLKYIERKSSTQDEKASLGQDLHNEWAKQHENIYYLQKGIRLIVFLMLVAVLIIMMFSNRFSP